MEKKINQKVHLVGVVLSLGVGGSKDRAACVQLADDTGLRDADRLLFHRLVDAGAIRLPDAVELVDAAQTAISEDQCSRLELPLASILIATASAKHVKY